MSRLIGHSPTEVVAALIGRPVEGRGLYVSAASLESGKEVLFLNDSDINRMGGVCRRFILDAGADDDASEGPLLRFVARHLVAVDLHSVPERYDTPAPDAQMAKILRWHCIVNAKPATLSDALMVVAAAPLFAASTPEAVSLQAQYSRGNAAISELSLGSPVPGGAAAFAGARPSVVKAVARADGAIDLQIDMGLRHWAPETYGPFAIHVLVQDGRVVRFAKGYLADDLACRLDGIKLHCQPPNFYQ